jgi:hypothetical protein
MLQAIKLILILNLQLQRLERFLEFAERRDPSGVVRGKRGTL